MNDIKEIFKRARKTVKNGRKIIMRKLMNIVKINGKMIFILI